MLHHAHPALREPEPCFTIDIKARHVGLLLALSRFPQIFILGNHDGEINANDDTLNIVWFTVARLVELCGPRSVPAEAER